MISSVTTSSSTDQPIISPCLQRDITGICYFFLQKLVPCLWALKKSFSTYCKILKFIVRFNMTAIQPFSSSSSSSSSKTINKLNSDIHNNYHIHKIDIEFIYQVMINIYRNVQKSDKNWNIYVSLYCRWL